MPTTFWTGNAQLTAQVMRVTITAVAAGGRLVTTTNGKSITYTCTAADTTTTTAAAVAAALTAAGAVVPEFGEVTYASSGGVMEATALVAGTPFSFTTGAPALGRGMAFEGFDGVVITVDKPVPNASPSDVQDPRNWLRGGVQALPQDGDDVVLADSSVPLLWNLDQLASVRFNSFTRWQTFTGTVGLPENNPLGYREWRPTYFQFAGGGSSASGSPSPSPGGGGGVLQMILGVGDGQGPSRERYDVGSSQVNCAVLASGPPQDEFAVRLLGTNVANVVSVVGTSLAVAMLPGETSALASAKADSGATLALGPGCTCTGTASVNLGTLILTGCAPAAVVADQGSMVTQTTTAAAPQLTYAAVTATGGSFVNWLSGSNVVTLTLESSSVFSKATDLRAMTVTNATIDGDTCQVFDPHNAITWANPATMRGAVSSGPITTGTGRTLRVA